MISKTLFPWRRKLEGLILPPSTLRGQSWEPVVLAYMLLFSSVMIPVTDAIRLWQGTVLDPRFYLASLMLSAFLVGLMVTNKKGYFRFSIWSGLLIASLYGSTLFQFGTFYEPATNAMLLIAVAVFMDGPLAGAIILLLNVGIFAWVLPDSGLSFLEQQPAFIHVQSLMITGMFLVVLQSIAWAGFRRAQKHAERSKLHAEKATQAKSVFLAHMSHELRTPLAGMIGLLRNVLRREDLDGTRDRLELAARNGESLLHIIGDLLDVAKIEAGKMTLESTPFRLGSLLGEALIPLRHLAHQKGLGFTLDCPKELAGAWSGDPGRLRQVLVNLAGNAVKFTERGHVAVRIQIVDEMIGAPEGEPEQVTVKLLEFVVEDTGIGMSDLAQGQLFREFHQLHQDQRKFGGTGLGLAISRGLVALMGGVLVPESRPQGGTVFRFTSPLTPTSHCPISSSELSDLPRHSHRLRILVAEDGHAHRLILEDILRGMGHQADFVEDGTDALRSLSRRTYDLVLLDGRMPLLDGDATTLAIRKGGMPGHPILNQDLPIIILTANALREDRDAYLEAGADAYLIKPVREVELHAEIGNAIVKRMLQGGELRPMIEDDSDSGADWMPVTSPNKAENRKKRLWDAFALEATKHGKAFEQAVSEGHSKEAGRLAHLFKGSAAALGLDEFRNFAAELEAAADAERIEEVAARLPNFLSDLEEILKEREKSCTSS
jgi:signal transduction histidine kinase/DNA-binding response OmpR family regulator